MVQIYDVKSLGFFYNLNEFELQMLFLLRLPFILRLLFLLHLLLMLFLPLMFLAWRPKVTLCPPVIRQLLQLHKKLNSLLLTYLYYFFQKQICFVEVVFVELVVCIIVLSKS